MEFQPDYGKKPLMQTAPIWSMQPMQNSLLDVMPLQSLDPATMALMTASQLRISNAKYRLGKGLLSEDERPAALWFGSWRDTFGDAEMESLLEKHDVFTIDSLIFVSGPLADVLGTCDLGCGRLTPVPALSHDRSRQFGKVVHLLEYPNQKDTVDRESTPRCKPMFPYGPNKYFTLPLNLTGRDVFVHRVAMGGVDLWFDPLIYGTQFASQTVAEKLIALGYQETFRLNPCKFMT
jgi:hypothetical protein